MSLANQKATTEYQEAIQATEDLESPAVGFAKTSDYKGGLTNQVNAVIKQNNTLLYLATKQSQKLVELEEKFDKLKQEIHTLKKKEGLPSFHLGIFMIRLHALHRRSAGTNALVVLRDTRWEDSRQIIATMEVDLSAGTQLVYTFPDMILSVNDFHNHVEVAIQTHGYSVDQHDREVIGNDNLDEDEEHFIGICSQAPQEEHISYDICFCEDCLNEARILEEEPLNKVRRSNKPKRSKQRPSEKWSTLGEPSGKWDYYVSMMPPPRHNTNRRSYASNWFGEMEFSDDDER
ncbi:hypothetical protein Tco_0127449 [Tanacetum coccineum]